MSNDLEVSLDLSSSSGRAKATKSNGAWDDGELVRAYDAALEEFHMHHPGPGTWLDKVTATTMQGQQLAGAKAFGTDWYQKPNDARSKRKRVVETEVLPVAAPNPYTAPITKHKTKRAASPEYAPPSPLPSESSDPQPPTMSIETASRTTYNEAIAYAMSAQYAAGYWLGVAHTKAAPPPEIFHTRAVESNVFHTRQDFAEQSTKLKR